MYQKSKPVVELERNNIDNTLSIIGWVMLVVLWVIPLAYWTELPEILPVHFNFNGTPDSFGGRTSIWFLPVLASILVSVFSFLNKVPHMFNYPVQITMQNASRLYALGIRMINLIKLLIVFWLSYINFQTIRIGLGYSQELGSWNMGFFIACLFALVAFFIFKANRIK